MNKVINKLLHKDKAVSSEQHKNIKLKSKLGKAMYDITNTDMFKCQGVF